ncbi:hypothetical protein B9Z19DRAFT_1093271 [Tuber borchii]|uniref:Uncharacterized protein n=1 Tax=Tuber borchii TaxID=42251 RepID=A0A2T6ZFI8_TUBBO|nr:hypothetical protein B9Z19DRAFT_1093271 [Tuber borchii]
MSLKYLTQNPPNTLSRHRGAKCPQKEQLPSRTERWKRSTKKRKNESNREKQKEEGVVYK